MIRSFLVRGSCAMVGVALLSSGLLGPSLAPAFAEDDHAAASTVAVVRAWDARVTGTGEQGLIVRQGPGVNHPANVILLEGARVRVVEGPRFDSDGRDWYRLTAPGLGSQEGWSSGEFLIQVEDGPATDASRVVGAVSTSARGRAFQAKITAYTYQTPGDGAHGSITRSGTRVRWGTVAVDPSVIPLGTRVMIEGFDDVFVAEDTGGGVRGNHVEIFFYDHASAMRFGVQYRTVTILGQ